MKRRKTSGAVGLVMMVAGALYAGYAGGAYLFMAVLSAAGLLGAVERSHCVTPSSAERN